MTSRPDCAATSALAASVAGTPLAPPGAHAQELERRGHGVGRELPAAGAGAGAGDVLQLVEVGRAHVAVR